MKPRSVSALYGKRLIHVTVPTSLAGVTVMAAAVLALYIAPQPEVMWRAYMAPYDRPSTVRTAVVVH
jgi:hypothetical protein